LPWHYPADLQFFKEKTMSQVILMGHATWLSLPRRPLPNRTHVVVTRDHVQRDTESVFFRKFLATALETAFSLTPPKSMPFVIGGESIYQQVLPQVTDMYLTRIRKTFQVDRFFPVYAEEDWETVWEKEDGDLLFLHKVRKVTLLDSFSGI
jgi:dihydrofolate reductase